jgi:fluoride exporter
MSAVDWAALALVGGVGAVARLRLDAAVAARAKSDFPLGTFVVNIVGSFALGILIGTHAASAALFIVGTGFLASFTTFSTWMFETQRLAEDGEVALAGWNIAASVAAGTVAAIAGWALGALL